MFQNFSAFPMMHYPFFWFNFYPNYSASQPNPPQSLFNHSEQRNTSNQQDIQNQENQKLTLTKEDFEVEGIGISKRHWSQQEDVLLKKYSQLFNFNWSQICKHLPGRNQKMCYSRYRRIQNEIKAYWTTQQNQDIKNWKAISNFFPDRTAKQIREHYLNFLRPNIKKDIWTVEQDMRIVSMYNQHGKKWKMFQKHFEGRTQNQIKNRFYGRLKRLQRKKEDLESSSS